MARISNFEKVVGRSSDIAQLRDPEVAGAYLASIFRDGDKNEIERAMTDIAEAYDLSRPQATDAKLRELQLKVNSVLVELNDTIANGRGAGVGISARTMKTPRARVASPATHSRKRRA